MEEGKVINTRVFINEYHGKPDSLILSACMNGKRIETVEVSLTTLKVVQGRGGLPVGRAVSRCIPANDKHPSVCTR